VTGTALDRDQAAVRLAIYRGLAAQGRPPSVAELAAETGLAETAVRSALQDLHDAHAIVLTPARDAVRMAHPFSAAPMGFVVSAEGPGRAGYAGDRMWWGGCAWDSFGIGAALGEPVVIRTRCPGCGRDLTVQAGPAQPPEPDLAVRIPCPARRWWDDVVGTCTNIRLFCDRSHAQAWAARAAVPPAGLVIPAVTVWRLAQPWYDDRLDPGWSPRPTAAAQRLLGQVGLTGDFWRLG
jgi:Alkylmercury lyase